MKSKLVFATLALISTLFCFIPSTTHAALFGPDEPSVSCEDASVGKILQTAEKQSTSTRGTSSYSYKYYKWECKRVNRGLYTWDEIGNQEKAPFAGVDFDSSVPADAKNPGGTSAGNTCQSPASCKATCDTAAGETLDTSKTCSGPKKCCVPKAGTAPTACQSPASCKATCDTAAGETLDTSKTCSGPKKCCVPKGTGGVPGAAGTNTTGSVSNTSPSGGANITFQNPLGFSSVEGFLGKVLSTLQGLIVTLALVFLVIGATLYIISGGNKERLGAGKAAMTAAVVGLAIALAAPAFLKEISDILGWNAASSEVSNALSLSQIALKVLNFLLSTVGILAIIMLLIGGGTILTAAGSEDRIETGKDIVKYAVIGIAIAFASLVIIRQIGSFFT